MGGTSSKPEAASKQQPPIPTQNGSPAKKQEDYNAPLANKTLPGDLQKLVDQEEETFWEQISEGRAPQSTESSLRYAAYANRLRTILLSAHRYVAYTSDIGESFRPVAHPWLVRGAYGVSWAYLIGDVSHEGYKAYVRQQQIVSGRASILGVGGDSDGNGPTSATKASGIEEFGKAGVKALKETAREVGVAATTSPGSGTVPAIDDYRAVMAQRATFQAIASMGLPAFTIHSIVRYSGQALKNTKNVRIRTWGPIGLGLSAVPLLPYMFDEPVEKAVEWTFHKAFETIGGPDAVGHSKPTGREQSLEKSNQERKIQKEL